MAACRQSLCLYDIQMRIIRFVRSYLCSRMCFISKISQNLLYGDLFSNLQNFKISIKYRIITVTEFNILTDFAYDIHPRMKRNGKIVRFRSIGFLEAILIIAYISGISTTTGSLTLLQHLLLERKMKMDLWN